MTSLLPVEACTVFVLDDGSKHYYGSNFDWHRGDGYVMVNPRGLIKFGWPLPDDPGNPVQWLSKFGSVTFVQYGQGFPKGGMNEVGLVIESLLFPGSVYPLPDNRPYIGSTSQLNQHILDTCATVSDVALRLASIRLAVYDWAPGVHFMVADAGGDCAVIEFLKGHLKIYRGNNLLIKALSNRAYAEPMTTEIPIVTLDFTSLTHSTKRIQTVSGLLARHSAGASRNAVAYAFDILDEVSAAEFTQWQVVYHQDARIVYWRCAPNESLRWVDLKKFDFECTQPIRALPIAKKIYGKANPYFDIFTPDDNRRLVYQAVAGNRLIVPIPENIRETMWQWPQHNICTKD